MPWLRRVARVGPKGAPPHVAFGWRCRPGHHPRTYELRCRECNRLAVVYETTTGELAFVPDQDGALRQVRERAREDAVVLTRADVGDRDR
jgi:hypothetical protein